MDAAQAELEGEVAPARAVGSIRYRVWPARRHPIRASAAGVLALAASAMVTMLYGLLWGGLILVGLTLWGALLLFPTDVALDSHSLHMRQLGTPRTWDLRLFRRLEVVGDVLPRVELGVHTAFDPTDTVKGVTLPLPGDAVMAGRVVTHVRHWVGRRPTGTFELDEDFAPEDTIPPASR